jgi:uncharacterized RDD family membrane protein YckC
VDNVRESDDEVAQTNAMTTEQYVQAVLDQMPPSTPRREQIGTELRGHILERLEHGVPLEEILRQLGDPVALASSYLAEVPLALPPHGRRIVAKIVDFVLVIAGMALLALALVGSMALINENLIWVGMVEAILLGGILGAFYTVVAEWRYGQTIGKYLCGLRVVRESGARISFGQSFVRQLPLFLQVGWIDAAFALFTDRRQRAFEMLTKTRVVAVDGDLLAETHRAHLPSA